jgi:hypothetical protein
MARTIDRKRATAVVKPVYKVGVIMFKDPL